MSTSRVILTNLFVFTLNLATAQYFVGILTYSVKYEVDTSLQDLENEVIQKLKEDGEYYDSVKVFIKQNRYLKQDNKVNPTPIIYDPVKNEIITLFPSEKTAFIKSGTQFNMLDILRSEPRIIKVDSVKNVNGILCNAVHLSWDHGEEWYFYNEGEVSIMPGIFKEHNYEYLNQVLDLTGSYPLEIVKYANQTIRAIFSIVKIESIELSDKVFDIPDLKPIRKRYANEAYEKNGVRMMRIKN